MDTPTWPALIRALIQGDALTADETAWAMNEIMEGAATPAQIAGFGVALRAKGETVEEMAGLASAMLAHATPITITGPVDRPGGDWRRRRADRQHLHHGDDRRGGVRECGWPSTATARPRRHPASADVLEALGVVIDLPPAATAALAQEIGIAFLFAPLYHPAFRHTGPVRKRTRACRPRSTSSGR